MHSFILYVYQAYLKVKKKKKRCKYTEKKHISEDVAFQYNLKQLIYILSKTTGNRKVMKQSFPIFRSQNRNDKKVMPHPISVYEENER